MNPSTLIPLKDLDKQTLIRLFRNDSDFAWNVRNWNGARESDYIDEIIRVLEKSGARIECEYGIYSPVRFAVVHTPNSMRDFISGLRKVQKDYCFLPDTDNELVERAQKEWDEYANNIDLDEDDAMLEKVADSVGILETEIRSVIRETFAYWENDRNLEECICDYAEFEWHDLWYSKEDDAIYEIRRVKQLDYY